MDFSKFDKKFDLDGLKEDIRGAGTNEFEKTPHGVYEVSLTKMELGESKKGDPMAIIWYNIVAGEHKNKKIFQYQLVTGGFQIKLLLDLLKDMKVLPPEDVDFYSFSQLNDLLLDIFEKVQQENLTFQLNYQANSKNPNFDTFKIENTFEN